jgi:hypothetical protein
VILLMFVVAQGAVIFGTAYLALRLLKKSDWFLKLAAMSVSYIAWVVITVAGYILLGGEGGLMDGFGMILMLCFFALPSSLVYALIWIFGSQIRRSATGV